MKTSYIAVASRFISPDEIRDVIDCNSVFLNKLQCAQIAPEQTEQVRELYYFIITGGTEKQILDLYAKRENTFGDHDITLLAHESRNSLPAALEVLARFQQDGKKGKIIYLPEVGNDLNPDIQPHIQKFEDYTLLSGKRIGLIGSPSDWLVASSPDINRVQENFGIEIKQIDLEEIRGSYRETGLDDTEVNEIVEDLTSKSTLVSEPSYTDIANNVRIYVALKKIISRYDLDALSIRCFDLVLDLNTTGCFALSLLNDEGVIAGCEGDLVSTIGMMWAFQNTGTLPWMANPSRINLKENSLILAHCTVPRSLVSSYSIRSHFESGIGVGVQGVFSNQNVSILRLGGRELNLIWKAEGKLIETGHSEDLCRTQLKLKLDDEYSVQDLLSHPLGNHHIIVP